MFVDLVTLCSDPAPVGEKNAVKLRLAVKRRGGKSKDWFITAILGGYEGKTALRLKKGDQIIIAGPLTMESYFNKKEKREVDDLCFGFGTTITRIVKSPSFFGQEEAKPADDAAVEAPAGDDDPLADC